jgi:uncharacterized membrane protein (UPF0127 family)
VVLEARGFRARLLGLAFLSELPPGYGLLIPRCSSVHTFGMRFALELVWLGPLGEVLRVDRAVPPGRVRSARAGGAVIELRSQPQDHLELFDCGQILQPTSRLLHRDEVL